VTIISQALKTALGAELSGFSRGDSPSEDSVTVRENAVLKAQNKKPGTTLRAFLYYLISLFLSGKILSSLFFFVCEFAKIKHQVAGDEDRGIGTKDHTQADRKGKVVQDGSTKEI